MGSLAAVNATYPTLLPETQTHSARLDYEGISLQGHLNSINADRGTGFASIQHLSRLSCAFTLSGNQVAQKFLTATCLRWFAAIDNSVALANLTTATLFK